MVKPTITIFEGTRIRNWGGWYRFDSVYADGECIGRFYIRRRNKRTEAMTISEHHGGAVLGCDVKWLLEASGKECVE